MANHLDSGAHQMQSTGAHQLADLVSGLRCVSTGAALRSGAKGPRTERAEGGPDPCHSGRLRPKGHVSIRLQRELVFPKETPVRPRPIAALPALRPVASAARRVRAALGEPDIPTSTARAPGAVTPGALFGPFTC